MLQQPDIDELLRARLQGAEVAPPAFVWPNVERALRRRRRRFLFFWLFAGGLLGAGALTFWLWHNPGVTPPGAQDSVQVQSVREGASTLQSGVETQAAEPGSATPAAIAGPAEETAMTAEVVPVAPVAERSGRSQTRAAFFGKRRDILALDQATIPTPSVPALVQPDATTDAAPVSFGPAAEITLLGGRSIPFLAVAPPDNLSKFRVAPPPAKKRRVRKNCYDFEKHASVWLIDAYAGPSATRKTLRTDADNEPYLNRRLNTEHRDWAFNAGVRASWLFDKHFLLRTGVHYDQFTEVFEYVDPSYVQTIVQYTTVIVNGQPVTVADTLQSTFGANYVKTYNRFGLLDIPLLAGVEWRQGNGGIALSAGASLNVLFWKRGDIIAPGADVPVTFTPGHQGLEVFRPRVGLSLSGSAQFFYHLRPRLRVFAEPYYRQVMQPVNQSGHPVEQRYGIGGIRIGLTRIID